MNDHLIIPYSPLYEAYLRDESRSVGRADSISFPRSEDEVCAVLKGKVPIIPLEERMRIAQDITSMVLALRRKVNIKVRQPLTTLMVPVIDETQRRHIEAMKELILAEVNVKDLKFVDNAAGILVKRVKPDFKKLGPRYGKII